MGNGTCVSKEELEYKYLVCLMTDRDIAKEYDVVSSTITRRRQRYSIPTHSITDETRHKLSIASKGHHRHTPYQIQRIRETMLGNTYGIGRQVSDEQRKKQSEQAMKVLWTNERVEELRHLYYDEELSTKEIAGCYGLCRSAIVQAMRRYKIPAIFGRVCKSVREQRRQQRIEYTKQIKVLYCNEEMSIGSIAKTLGISRTMVRKCMEENDIEVRSHQEATRISHNKSGFKHPFKDIPAFEHPAWRGGRFKQGKYYYVYAPERASARGSNSKYMAEHIKVWEDANGRTLPKGWVVHHLNGNTIDNRPKNLMAMPNMKHIHILRAKSNRIQWLEQELLEIQKRIEKQKVIALVP